VPAAGDLPFLHPSTTASDSDRGSRAPGADLVEFQRPISDSVSQREGVKIKMNQAHLNLHERQQQG
jgi:hypothetical protein